MSQKKQIFKLNILKKLLTDENSCVSLMPSTRLLALPPFFLTDMKSGILYLLNSMLKKYDRSLGGIVIGYQNIKVLMDENTGIIPIGTSEMEVNISVEFYIFQPKIGSYLEGVINKKSNNHVGCLVHQYFNASILKPEDVLYEDWICKDFNVDDKIIFKVIDLDFTTLLPYIEGIYDGKLSLDKIECKSSGNCDIDDTVGSSVNKNCKNEDSFSKEFLKCATKSEEMPDDNFLEVTKVKNKCKKNKVNMTNVKTNLEESRSFTGTETKNKEMEEKCSPTPDVVKDIKEKISNDKEMNLDQTGTKLQDDGKKKKKKRKRNRDESNEQQSIMEVENIEKDADNSIVLPSHIHEKLLQVEDEDSNDFVKFSKIKKEKKKKKIQNEEALPSLSKANECLPPEEVEENILYSTQLEPGVGSKKMRISFCSPIPQSTPFVNTELGKNKVSESLYDQVDATEKEMKEKHKKRKREKQEEVEDTPAAKKIKISNTASSKKEEEKSEEVNGGDQKSIVQIMVEQLCQEQLNRVKEELNMSSSDKEEKKKKEKKKKKREKEQNESVEISNAKSLLNGKDAKSELQSTLNELFRKELQKVKEQLSKFTEESLKESKKKKEKVKKEEKETPKERVVDESLKVKESEIINEKKFATKNIMDELCQQQLYRVKEESSMPHTISNIKDKKKKKSGISNQDVTNERTHDSLYDKLLNEAKNAMQTIAAPIPPPAADLEKKKKDSELSDVSTSSSRKKKSKHSKQKIEDCHLPPSKFKNGSMYDVVPTPEKINPDKSLFSDSEQSHTSPVKKKKAINGVKDESEKSKVQNIWDDFYKEEIKRLKSESDRENSKTLAKVSKKKSSAEEKPKVLSGEEESLYEKLLKQAKSLIDVKDVSLPSKKEKKAKKTKTVQDCVRS